MKVLYLLAAVVLTVFAQETPVLRELRTGNLKFSANAYKELAAKNAGKNFLACPLSVSVVLALAEAGAGGNTAKQLISGLSLPDTEEKIHEAYKSIAPGLNVNDKYTLTSANKIYLKEGYKIKPEFKKVATQTFNAEIEEINFVENELSAKKINKWVLQKTNDKIKDLVSKDDLDENSRAVLINALYFYGQWIKPFYEESTSEKPFKVSSKQEVRTKIMEQTDKFNYYEDASLNAKFLEMKYFSSPISMIIVLPNDVDGLPALEANIEKVLETPKFKYEEVHVQIPHVGVESTIDFIPILRKFGVNDAFERYANFNRLKDTEEELYISKIIQKTFIAIEEKGTTAAAATAVFMGVGFSAPLYPPPPPKEFEANHPFIFIVKSDTGVLFIGRYVDPSKK